MQSADDVTARVKLFYDSSVYFICFVSTRNDIVNAVTVNHRAADLVYLAEEHRYQFMVKGTSEW